MVKLYFNEAIDGNVLPSSEARPKALNTAPPENNILIIFRSSSRELAGVLSLSA
jgi:hypothetical protein